MKYFNDFDNFNNSVVNKIVFHCSRTKFDKFKSEYITNINGEMYGKGFYFTDNVEYAKQFGDIIYKCYIQLQNPIDLYNNDRIKVRELLLKLSEGIDDDRLVSNIEHGNRATAFRIILKHKTMVDFKKMGFDGIIAHCEAGGKEFVVFDEDQIKIIL